MSIIRKIKESIITKWIVLYYTFFFILGSYLLLQLLFTTLQFLFFANPDQSITIQGFYVVIDGIQHQIWDLPQFHIAIILSSVIIIGLIYLMVKLLVKVGPIQYLGFSRPQKEHLVWLLYSAIVLIFGIVLRELVINTSEIAISAEGLLEKTLVVLGLGIFGPVFEETLYRGFLLVRMDDILKSKHQWITIVTTAALFAVFHFQYNPIELIYVFGIGVFLALMRFKTGSLWFPVIFHVAGNIYAVVTLIF